MGLGLGPGAWAFEAEMEGGFFFSNQFSLPLYFCVKVYVSKERRQGVARRGEKGGFGFGFLWNVSRILNIEFFTFKITLRFHFCCALFCLDCCRLSRFYVPAHLTCGSYRSYSSLSFLFLSERTPILALPLLSSPLLSSPLLSSPLLNFFLLIRKFFVYTKNQNNSNFRSRNPNFDS